MRLRCLDRDLLKRTKKEAILKALDYGETTAQEDSVKLQMVILRYVFADIVNLLDDKRKARIKELLAIRAGTTGSSNTMGKYIEEIRSSLTQLQQGTDSDTAKQPN